MSKRKKHKPEPKGIPANDSVRLENALVGAWWPETHGLRLLITIERPGPCIGDLARLLIGIWIAIGDDILDLAGVSRAQFGNHQHLTPAAIA